MQHESLQASTRNPVCLHIKMKTNALWINTDIDLSWAGLSPGDSVPICHKCTSSESQVEKPCISQTSAHPAPLWDEKPGSQIYRHLRMCPGMRAFTHPRIWFCFSVRPRNPFCEVLHATTALTSTSCGKCRAKLKQGKWVTVSSAPSILMQTAEVILHNHKPSKKAPRSPFVLSLTLSSLNQYSYASFDTSVGFPDEGQTKSQCSSGRNHYLCMYLNLLPGKVKAFLSGPL